MNILCNIALACVFCGSVGLAIGLAGMFGGPGFAVGGGVTAMVIGILLFAQFLVEKHPK